MAEWNQRRGKRNESSMLDIFFMMLIDFKSSKFWNFMAMFKNSLRAFSERYGSSLTWQVILPTNLWWKEDKEIFFKMSKIIIIMNALKITLGQGMPQM